jgi:hypothetical protein
MDLFSDCGPANDVATLKYECFQSGFAQIAGCHESIMTAADDDDVVTCHR